MKSINRNSRNIFPGGFIPALVISLIFLTNGNGFLRGAESDAATKIQARLAEASDLGPKKRVEILKDLLADWPDKSAKYYRSEKFKEAYRALIESQLSLKKYQAAATSLSEARKNGVYFKDQMYLDGKIKYHLGKYRDAWGPLRNYLTNSYDAEKFLEALDYFVGISFRMKSPGGNLFFFNEAVKRGFLKKDEYYYKNVILSLQFFSRAPTVFNRYLQGATENPDSEFLQNGVWLYAHQMSGRKREEQKAAARALEKILYKKRPAPRPVRPEKLLNLNQGETTNTPQVLPSSSAEGPSRYQISLFDPADEKWVAGKKDAGLKKSNGDYATYNREVLNPWDGIVVLRRQKSPDHAPGKNDTYTENLLVVMHELGKFSYFYNLRYNSADDWPVGSFVPAGAVLARVGNNGPNKLPVLKYELRDRGRERGRSLPLALPEQKTSPKDGE